MYVIHIHRQHTYMTYVHARDGVNIYPTLIDLISNGNSARMCKILIYIYYFSIFGAPIIGNVKCDMIWDLVEHMSKQWSKKPQ